MKYANVSGKANSICTWSRKRPSELEEEEEEMNLEREARNKSYRSSKARALQSCLLELPGEPKNK